MAQQGMGGERTEKPTGKHRNDARKDGNIFKSQEITTLASLVFVFYAIDLLYPFIYGRVTRIFVSEFDLIETTEEMNPSNLMILFMQWLLDVTIILIPVLLIAAAVSIITTMAQTKGFMSMKPLKPTMQKLNPVKKFGEFFKRVFGPQGWMTTLTSIAKVIVIFWVIYITIKDDIYVFFRLMDMTVPVAVGFTGDLILEIVKNVAIAYLFIVAADYGFQKFQYEKKLKMSKKEIEEENKMQEGDPQIKAKIKQKQREMSMSRMMQAVPTADVVIRNPTHYAVALKYDNPFKDKDKSTDNSNSDSNSVSNKKRKNEFKSEAPVVVAKGKDYMALKIIAVAEENNIPLVENRPLARGLYENVEIDNEIPAQFYQAVADVLAFIYKAKENKNKRF